MTTQAWEQARQTVVAFWRQRRPEEVPAIDAELVYGRTQVREALAVGDRSVEEALIGDWQRKLRRLLTADPSLGAELQRVLDEELTPLLPDAEAARITKIRMNAKVSGHGRAYMSGRDMTVNRSRTKHIFKQMGAFPLVMLVTVAVVAILSVAWLVIRVTDDNAGPSDTVPVSTEITIEPRSGPPGTPVHISGRGFEPGNIVQVICQDPMSPQLGQFRAADDGSFTGEIRIPQDEWISGVGVQLAIVAASGQAQDSDRQGLAFFTVRR
ncbi:hypothetical protein CVT30_30900 [Streptomyces sp. AMCC400023]|nr:hypothetical protein CVT30_30900 [Streptomyces sp. AMCC400023]